MGYSQNEQINATLASKLIKNSVKLILALFTFVGKPLYLILSYSFLSLTLIAYITGYSTRKILKYLLRLLGKTAPPGILKVSVLINQFIKIVIHYFLHLKLPSETKVRKRGVIFKAPGNRIEKAAQVLKKTYCKSLPAKFENLSWKSSVFFIAVQKLAKKSYLSLKESIYKSSPKIYLPLVANKILRTKVRSILPQLSRGRQVCSLLHFHLWSKLHGFSRSLNKTRLKIIQVFSPFNKPTLPKIPIRKSLTFTMTTTFILGSVSVFFFWQVVLKDLPSAHDLTTRNIEASTKIYDRNGNLLYKIYKDKNRTPVTLDEIPLHVRLATIAIEDANFYSHPGFSFKGILRAVYKNLKEGKLFGGSTITQQLVKNALLTSEKTLVRKLREITLAIQVELTYEKDEILEMYLNEVSYGGTAYGVQEASQMYFGKDVDKLNLAEAALLAGLPKSPTKFSPYSANPDAAVMRQKEVLRLMRERNFISKDQKKAAEEQSISFAKNKIDIKAPHFVMYVKQILEEKYGKEVIEKGGLEVITTLDLQIQKLAETVVRDEVGKLARLNVSNGAATVINPSTGEILAMAGSIDYFDTKKDGNVNVTTRPRQPGSSIKVVNYAYALSNGYTPATILNDSPTTFLVDGQPPYTPKNYEGGFRGKLTLRSALAESRNVPAVKVLASYGVENMLEMGRKMGISTWKDPKNYGLSLTLGGGEVTLLDLATVYATVANYGKRPNLTSVLKVTNSKGIVLMEFTCEQTEQTPLVARASATHSAFKNPLAQNANCDGEQVLDPRIAFTLTDILRDNNARAPSFGTNSLLVIPNHKEVAVKTGTSNNLRDNLAVGFNQNYLIAAWVGNNDNSEMSRIASGITGATPIFNKIMSSLLASESNHDWQVPSGLVQLSICPYTGTLACSGCPVKTEWFLEENRPQSACNPDWFKKKEKDKEGLPSEASAKEGQILPEAARIEVVDTRKRQY